jgi:ribosomal protein L11 methyltransferase
MSDSNKWVEVCVTTSHEAVEAVSAIFYDNGAGGVAIEDPQDVISSNTSPRDWDYIEERLLPEDNGEARVKGYFLYTEKTGEIVNNIKSAVNKLDEYGLDRGKGEVTIKEVVEQDWSNAWKKYYKPFKIGQHIVIKPSWEEYNQDPEDIIIELDPGMAFGTGTHETTRMCIELLEEYIKDGSLVFDIGCGSGILSIVSSKLGAEKVIGVDIDEVAVKASRENAEISRVKNVEIKQGNLADVLAGKADLVVANIIADVIINLSKVIPDYLNSQGTFICSGIISDRLPDVKKALIENGFNIIKVKEMGEWAAMACSRER